MRDAASVSCVIPVFNGERFLGEAIESALAQTVPVAEIIVVDDGSTDATRYVAGKFGERLVYVYQSNAGTAAARNSGIRRATREFVALLDSDDLWYPEKTAVQMARFESQPSLVICTAQMRNFWSKEVEAEIATLKDARLLEVQPNLGSSFMARRSLFTTAGLLDEGLRHRDIQELILRTTDLGFVVEAVPEVLVRRRIHDANDSRRRGDPNELELIAIARDRIARRRRPPA